MPQNTNTTTETTTTSDELGSNINLLPPILLPFFYSSTSPLASSFYHQYLTQLHSNSNAPQPSKSNQIINEPVFHPHVKGQGCEGTLGRGKSQNPFFSSSALFSSHIHNPSKASADVGRFRGDSCGWQGSWPKLGNQIGHLSFERYPLVSFNRDSTDNINDTHRI